MIILASSLALSRRFFLLFFGSFVLLLHDILLMSREDSPLISNLSYIQRYVHTYYKSKKTLAM